MQDTAIKYANPVQRTVAFIIDFVIIRCLMLLANTLFMIVVHFLRNRGTYPSYSEANVELAWIKLAIYFLIWIGYFTTFEHSSLHATIGKMALKIKVFLITDTPVSWGLLFLRNIVKISPFMLFQIYGIWMASQNTLRHFDEGAWLQQNIPLASQIIFVYAAILYGVSLFNKRKQTIYDVLTKTIVVKTDDNQLKQLYLQTKNFIQHLRKAKFLISNWIPAFAGMTK